MLVIWYSYRKLWEFQDNDGLHISAIDVMFEFYSHIFCKNHEYQYEAWNQREEIFTKVCLRKVNDLKAPFSLATTPRCKGGCNFFSMNGSTLPLIPTL